MVQIDVSMCYAKTESFASHVNFIVIAHFDEVRFEEHGLQVIFYDYRDTTIALLDTSLSTVEIA